MQNTHVRIETNFHANHTYVNKQNQIQVIHLTNQTNVQSNPEVACSNPNSGEIRFQLSHSFKLGEYIGTQEKITERKVVRTSVTIDINKTINKSNIHLYITILKNDL